MNGPDKALLSQHPKGVINGMPRDGTDLRANVLDNLSSRTVTPSRHDPQNGEAVASDLGAMLAKKRFSIH